MQVTVVGSGTVVPHPEKVCAAIFVEVDDRRILLDCGPGAVHHMARFGIPWAALSHVALSHFHTDHIGDLPALFFALRYALAQPRGEELRLIGPDGTVSLLRRLADAYGDHLVDPGFPVRVTEVGAGNVVELDGVRMHVTSTPHTAASVAYRVVTSHGELGYTGDTGASEALGDFFRGVDLLIAECSLPDEKAMDSHLTPRRVAALARSARPRRLVLTHIYPPLELLDPAELVRRAGWDGEIIVAEDGSRFDL